MAVKLNGRGYDHAKKLVQEGRFVRDERDAWSEDQPSTETENQIISERGFREYAKWHLGINDEKSEDTKGRYEFPYGDFQNVHRCGAISAESRAGQYQHPDIEKAAAHLHGMIDEKQGKKAGKTKRRRTHVTRHPRQFPPNTPTKPAALHCLSTSGI